MAFSTLVILAPAMLALGSEREPPRDEESASEDTEPQTEAGVEFAAEHF